MKNKTIQLIDNVNPLHGIIGFFYGSPKWLYPDSSETSENSLFQYLHCEDPESIIGHSNRHLTMSKDGFRFPCVDNVESGKKHMVIEKTHHGQGGSIPLKIEITIE